MRAIYIIGMVVLLSVMMVIPASAQTLTCPCDICVNETGWWRDGEAFNAVVPSIWTNVDTGAMNNVNDGNTVFVYNGTYQMANGLQFIEPNVTLIGMPGSGKSTVGIILAKKLSLGFIDTDIVIQMSQEQSLQEIIEESSYLHLRRVEEEEILKIRFGAPIRRCQDLAGQLPVHIKGRDTIRCDYII